MIANQYEGVLPEPGAFSDTDTAILRQGRWHDLSWHERRWRHSRSIIGLMRSGACCGGSQPLFPAVSESAVGIGEDRSSAPAQPCCTYRPKWFRQVCHSGRQPGYARLLAGGSCSTCLGIPADQRDFAGLGGAARIKPGTGAARAKRNFPRYIEPTAA